MPATVSSAMLKPIPPTTLPQPPAEDCGLLSAADSEEGTSDVDLSEEDPSSTPNAGIVSVTTSPQPPQVFSLVPASVAVGSSVITQSP